MLTWHNLLRLVERHRIIYGVIAALLISILLTVVSMALYVSSGASRLDLSRPGYERVRSDVQRTTDEDSFSANGPINTDVANEFQALYSKHRDRLSKLDTYGTNALDDSELQIAPTPRPAQ